MNKRQSRDQLRSEVARLQAHNQELQARLRLQDEQEQGQRQAWMMSVFARGGEAGALMAKIDWASTPVGPIEEWSQSMCMTLSLCLSSRFPMLLLWGPEYTQFYNDAYIPILGTKHPTALGQDAASSWPETWQKNGTYAGIRKSDELTFYQNARYNLFRHGYLEETYFTGTYSPLRDEMGRISGLLSSTMETTQQVLLERRIRLVGELASRTTDLQATSDVCETALQVLGEHPEDLPFALLYWLSDNGRLAYLRGYVGLSQGTSLVPEQLVFADMEASAGRDALVQATLTQQAQRLEDLSPLLGKAPLFMQEQRVCSASVLPIGQGHEGRPVALLVAGISPYRAFDSPYRDFFQLVATQIGTALASARSYQEARMRIEDLAALDQAKTSFFNNISHEFRTPLTLILGPLEDLLVASPESSSIPLAVREQLIFVRRNALRLLKLVNTLLDFSRIEAGRIHASYVPTDLSALTTDLASMFRSAIERAGLQLRVDCPALSEPVYVDPEMWEKIVLNLLSNAFKFTFKGEIAVCLHQKDDQVELVVYDTGTGIPADELPHLFERFHRVQGTHARTHEGSGIGLALASDLVHLHGGTVSVTSLVGQGSTFTVAIPTGSAHLPAAQVQATSSAFGSPQTRISYIEEAMSWLSGGEEEDTTLQVSEVVAPFPTIGERSKETSRSVAHILIAEDNADMRAYLVFLLRNAGYAVEAVTHGRAALTAMADRLPDLLLSDVMMPELDGLQLLQHVRADPSTQRLPVILLSARAGEEAAIEGLALGTDDYLMKPFSARELLARVRANVELGFMREQAVRAAQRHVTQLQGLYNTLLAVHSTLSPNLVLNLISQQARDLLEAEYALTSFTSNQEQAQTLVSASSITADPPSVMDLPFPAPADVQDTIHQQLEPLRKRYAALLHHPASSPYWLEAPLLQRDGSEIGLVQVIKTTEGRFGEDDRLVLLQLVQMTSIAMENARSYQNAQETITSQQERDKFTSALTSSISEHVQTLLLEFASYLQASQVAMTQIQTHALVSTQKALLQSRHKRIQGLAVGVEHARSLLTQLQDYMLLQNNHLYLDTTDHIDLVPLVHTVLAPARVRHPLHLFMVVAEQEALWACCDQTRTQQVISTLLTYAASQSAEGTLITVRLQEEKTDNAAHMYVQYEGPERVYAEYDKTERQHQQETYAQIFDPTYWLKEEPTHLELGLALYLSAAIIKLHTGRIWTEQHGRNYYICFTLPKKPQLQNSNSMPDGEAR